MLANKMNLPSFKCDNDQSKGLSMSNAGENPRVEFIRTPTKLEKLVVLC